MSDEHTENDSDYYTYVQKVKTMDDVQRGYLMCRFRHGDATHISYAYRLNEANGPFHQEGIDDEEHGVGCTILDKLKSMAAVNIAVFVVRYYDRKQLGKRRFKILEQLTQRGLAIYHEKVKDRSSRLEWSSSQASLDLITSLTSSVAEVSTEGHLMVTEVGSVESETPQLYQSAEENLADNGSMVK